MLHFTTGSGVDVGAARLVYGAAIFNATSGNFEEVEDDVMDLSCKCLSSRDSGGGSAEPRSTLSSSSLAGLAQARFESESLTPEMDKNAAAVGP